MNVDAPHGHDPMVESVDLALPFPPVEFGQPVIAQPTSITQRCAGRPVRPRLFLGKSSPKQALTQVVQDILRDIDPERPSRPFCRRHAAMAASISAM